MTPSTLHGPGDSRGLQRSPARSRDPPHRSRPPSPPAVPGASRTAATFRTDPRCPPFPAPHEPPPPSEPTLAARRSRRLANRHHLPNPPSMPAVPGASRTATTVRTLASTARRRCQRKPCASAAQLSGRAGADLEHPRPVHRRRAGDDLEREPVHQRREADRELLRVLDVELAGRAPVLEQLDEQRDPAAVELDHDLRHLRVARRSLPRLDPEQDAGIARPCRRYVPDEPVPALGRARTRLERRARLVAQVVLDRAQSARED